MRIIVIGAGDVGFDVARMLSMERHDVTVVDLDRDRLDSVSDRLDVLTIQGNGTSAGVLEQAGVRKADMLIAVTNTDEVNVIACMMGDRMGIETTVARVRSNEYTHTKSVLKRDELGIDLIIHPEESTAAEVVRLIRRASATDVFTFGGGQLQLLGIRLDPDAPVINRSLRDIILDDAHLTFRIMGISRGIRTIVPRGDEILRKNDQIFVLSYAKEVAKVARLMGKSDQKIQDVMILGGSPVGAKVAQLLSQERGKRIKLVEADRRTAARLAEELEDVLVIHGSATDVDLLVTEGIGEMDAFVAVTGSEESNLVMCLLAKHLGVKKTVAMLSEMAYIPFSQSIGLDAAVSKKMAVSREVLRFLRGKHVLSVATVPGLDAEILETQAARDAPITRKPLKELVLPKGLLVGAVIGHDGIEVATGDTRIHAGDRVITFALPQVVHEVERLFDNKAKS